MVCNIVEMCGYLTLRTYIILYTKYYFINVIKNTDLYVKKKNKDW